MNPHAIMCTQFTFCVLVAEGGLPHVAQLDRALARAVHEQVAVLWMELGGRDHLGQLFHVGRLDIHNICDLSLSISTHARLHLTH